MRVLLRHERVCTVCKGKRRSRYVVIVCVRERQTLRTLISELTLGDFCMFTRLCLKVKLNLNVQLPHWHLTSKLILLKTNISLFSFLICRFILNNCNHYQLVHRKQSIRHIIFFNFSFEHDPSHCRDTLLICVNKT